MVKPQYSWLMRYGNRTNQHMETNQLSEKTRSKKYAKLANLRDMMVASATHFPNFNKEVQERE